jgi:hypothetical protein
MADTTNVKPAAGCKLYIGGTGVLTEEASWVEVGEIVDFGELGAEFELITHKPVGTRTTFKFKGAKNEGQMSLQLGQDLEDAGQDDLRDARDSDFAYNFKIEYNDAAAASGSTNTTDTFKAMVMGFKTQIGGVDSIISATSTLEISGDITRTAAA